jgi:penicillin G amidase
VLGESYLHLLTDMANAKTLFDVQDGLAKIPKWKSIPTNVVLADSSGNIGYMLLSTSPMRRNEYPHLGCRVLDGSTSYHDWLDVIDLKNLPFVINPKKGYFLTANNRVVPENSRFDVGASMIATGRSIRINEMIEEGLAAGKKFTASDMVEMQQDMTDVYARDLVKHIIKIVENLDFDEHHFTRDVVSDILSMVEELRQFKGIMVEDSVGASVYSYWQYYFYSTLLTEFTSDGDKESTYMDKDEKFWTPKKRLLLVDNYAFYDFY